MARARRPVALATVIALILSLVAAAAPPCVSPASAAAGGGGSTRIEFTLSAGPFDIAAGEEGWDVVNMEGFATGLSPGEPMLPHKAYDIALPPDVVWSSLDLQLVSAETLALEGKYDIQPAPPPLPGSAATWTGNWQGGGDANTAGSDAGFPESSVDLVGCSQMRKWSFARVDFSPFQYEPASGELALAESVTIQMTFDRTGAMPQEISMQDTAMDDVARDIFLNYEEARAWYEAEPGIQPQVTYDYVIITTDAIVSNSTKLASFVTHKQGQGFSVLVVTQTKTGGGAGGYGGLTGQAPDHRAEKMRQWLINNYLSTEIEYVLLIGDPTPRESGGSGSCDVPMKMCHPELPANPSFPQLTATPTDYFYADLTGNWDFDGDQNYGEWTEDYGPGGGVDFAPEVYVGRIPVYECDCTTLDSILQKTMDYENDSGDLSWRNNILLPMGFQYHLPPPNGYDGAMLAEQMWTNYLNAAGFSRWSMYQQGNDPCALASSYTPHEELRGSPATPNVFNRWTGAGSPATPNDFGIVCWWAHGSAISASVGYGTSCWDGTLFQSSDCSSLDDNHPAFTYQCSCSNGYPENGSNLQYSILKQGGVATVSASRVSWFSYTQTNFASSPTNSGLGYEYVSRLAQYLAASKALYDSKAGVVPNHQCWLMNWYDFNLYGDPALSLAQLEEPVLEFGDAPDPNYPSLLARDGARHNPTGTEILGLQSQGDGKDYETDANVPDLDLYDDGLLTKIITAGQASETVTFEVTDFLSATLYVNILIDLNRDGDWSDVGEHVVVNQVAPPGPGEWVLGSNSFSTVGANLGATWLRITLTRIPISSPPWDGTMLGWDGRTDPFEFGETEDHEIWVADSTPQEIQIALKAGWNMVSVPVVPGDTSVSSVFPGAQAVYTWDPITRSYCVPTNVEPEKGYWVAVIADTNVSVTGTVVPGWTSSITAGWNMIGSIYGKDVDFTNPDDNPDGSVEAFTYWWNPSTRSYDLTYTLETKKGHWVAATQNCQLTVS